MCFTNDETAEFSRSEIRCARTKRKCDCCWKSIQPGEQYEYGTGRFDGEFYQTATCRRCLYDISRIVAHELDAGCDWYDSWPQFEDVHEALEDMGTEQTDQAAVPAIDFKEVWPHKLIDSLRTVAA